MCHPLSSSFLAPFFSFLSYSPPCHPSWPTNCANAYLWDCVLSNILLNPSSRSPNSSPMVENLGSAGRVRKSAHDRLESHPVVGLGNFFGVCVPPAIRCRHSSCKKKQHTACCWLSNVEQHAGTLLTTVILLCVVAHTMQWRQAVSLGNAWWRWMLIYALPLNTWLQNI